MNSHQFHLLLETCMPIQVPHPSHTSPGGETDMRHSTHTPLIGGYMCVLCLLWGSARLVWPFGRIVSRIEAMRKPHTAHPTGKMLAGNCRALCQYVGINIRRDGRRAGAIAGLTCAGNEVVAIRT